MGLFRAAQGWRGMAHSLKSITCTTKMKVGSYTLPKEDPKKYMNHVT